jgi:hypothetical protein
MTFLGDAFTSGGVYYKVKNEDENRENRESMERKYLENF